MLASACPATRAELSQVRVGLLPRFRAGIGTPLHASPSSVSQFASPKRLVPITLAQISWSFTPPTPAKTCLYYASPGRSLGLVTAALALHVTPIASTPIGPLDLCTLSLSLEMQQNIPSKTPAATAAGTRWPFLSLAPHAHDSSGAASVFVRLALLDSWSKWIQ
jgi:hypothetical protein